MYPFDRYTRTARHAIASTQALVVQEGTGSVGLTHLLLALEGQTGTLAGQLVAALRLHEAVTIDDAPQVGWLGGSPYAIPSQQFLSCVGRAFAAADARGSATVGTVDVLMGLLAETGDEVALARTREALAKPPFAEAARAEP